MRISRFQLWSFVVALLLSSSAPCFAQVQTGTPPFASYGGGLDIINLGNLNAHLTVPIVQKAGRGTNFTYYLNLDSSVWYPVGSSGSQSWAINGLPGQFGSSAGHVYRSTVRVECPNPEYPPTLPKTLPSFYWTNFGYVDVYGVSHPFDITWENDGCQVTGPSQALATDGSGYTMSVDVNGIATVTARTGNLLSPPTSSGTGAASMTDANGNQITESSTGVITDTLGITALTIAGSSPTTFKYTAPNGQPATYTANYTSETVKTNFGCSGIAEFGPTAESLLSSITLPDGTAYMFTYEPTPGFSGDVTGRLKAITLPTGGTITYTYSGGSSGGITCTDGSTATLTRTTPDGTWTYAHTESGTAWTTTVTDPQSNKTTINFQGIYETERQVNQGASTLLKTTYTCYNGNTVTSTCNSTAITLPITQRSTFLVWPGVMQSRHDIFYNSVGLVTEKDDYAYGSGAPGALARKTLTTYASLTNGILNRPATITVEDGLSNIKSQAAYTYDQGSVTATSGTPQHVAVSGSRGNATTIANLVGGSTTLSQSFTYYDTGVPNTVTDVNGAQTTYNYGSGSCGNSFPTSVTEPLNLTRSMIWNCTGGVESSMTDENGKTVSTTYNDSDFWRPNANTDQEFNVTNITYNGETSIENSLLYGSASTSDNLATTDKLGRPLVSQRKQSPSSSTYDSVETDYDSLGRPSRTTVPYSAGAGLTNSSAPSTSTTYDALNRKSQIKDGGGGTVTLAYTQNDTYLTRGPAPTGENPKRKQFEYDSLGRMTSVCEVTSATGSGACAQTSAATGYWTTYTYDVLNHVISVTQNAQSSRTQTRTYAYDDLGRMTSELNPESGTTTYYYDTDTTCGTSKGDLVKKIDAYGNTICYTYDALHRTTSITIPSGPYAASTPGKYFVYDAATVNSIAMSNVKTHVAEAYTCTGSCTSKITDLGFSYTVRGETSDLYESTPHSGGYYHTSTVYSANGAVGQLGSSIATLPTFSYALDGEGRINAVSASAGQNPLTGTTYNVASSPTAVNLGSSDNDSFMYDPNTNRMTQYKFTVNSQSVVGALTWNDIGTLEDLVVTDSLFSGGNQSCAYTHDDLSRIASANCGSPWSQTFSYDAFGNVDKNGTVSFQPTYSEATNRITTVGSSTASYDANGNATNDTAHTYTWDAAGHPVTVDNVGLTYDALGRMVEQNKSGAYSEIVYTPLATKFAIVNGSTLIRALVPLTGGAQAVYNSSGLAYYRHSDWVGSSRFASTPSRTLYYDGAYAPFGEPYAQTGTGDLSFTGMDQDTVPNLYDFPAREYNDIHGRWPSPDPAGMTAVQINNPQSWNRYAYVLNNPLASTDPQGLRHCMLADVGPVSNECMGNGLIPPGTTTSDVVDSSPTDPIYFSICLDPAGCDSGQVAQSSDSSLDLIQLITLGVYVQLTYGVTMTDYTTSQLMSNGSFTGTMSGDGWDPDFVAFMDAGCGCIQMQDGQVSFTVTNDVFTYGVSAMQSSNGQLVMGFTSESDGFSPYTNYSNSNIVLESELQQVQVWELGNSLSMITGAESQVQINISLMNTPGYTEPGDRICVAVFGPHPAGCTGD
jgi:RHS repeat-associated protein